ncbi:MAG TPA: hypothetical protein VGW57_04400 [Chthoniobacterales bacterium]|nr:hypothetical protein [Chthoniobacterales bacterium]
MTVAHVREQTAADAVEVMFLESARFYRLLRTNPKFDVILAQLRAAIAEQRSLQITLTRPEGDIIAEAST